MTMPRVAEQAKETMDTKEESQYDPTTRLHPTPQHKTLLAAHARPRIQDEKNDKPLTTTTTILEKGMAMKKKKNNNNNNTTRRRGKPHEDGGGDEDDGRYVQPPHKRLVKTKTTTQAHQATTSIRKHRHKGQDITKFGPYKKESLAWVCRVFVEMDPSQTGLIQGHRMYEALADNTLHHELGFPLYENITR
jgi:hypothetical protein